MLSTIQIQNSVQFIAYVQNVVPTVSAIKEALKVADSLIPDKEIAALNLEAIMVKIKLEKKWEIPQILTNYLFYKQFLYLSKYNTEVSIVPTKEVDEFWHFHIQDTQKYAEDCQYFLGRMFHHFPYFGIRSQEDAQNALIAKQNTNALLAKTFGLPVWIGSEDADCMEVACSHSCNSCTSCTTENIRNERPSLETIQWA